MTDKTSNQSSRDSGSEKTKAADKSTVDNTADSDATTEEETPNSEVEAGENWPDGAPDAVKAYEELRANPPEEQGDMTPKPE